MVNVKEVLQTKVMVFIMAKGLEELSKIDEEFQEEIEDFEAILQWNIASDIRMYLAISDGRITAHMDAEHDDPTVTFIVEDYAKARAILGGEIDGTSAYMSGDLKMDGEMQAGMRMGQLGEFLTEALGDILRRE
ncbi:MAG: SCP2 sterol-binding domain-containing protein [Candidatus Helarchaeota archaeon]|nr:SCP2 sterol-binding domain-containing protein [Candidatus Helarchaeota archaeon]